jgi:protein-disulfide isomerase
MASPTDDFIIPEILREKKKKNPKRWFKRWWGRLIIGFLIILSILLIAIGIYVGKVAIMLRTGQITPKQLFGSTASVIPTNDPKLEKVRKLVEDEISPRLGPKNAKIVIVEFADFQCPACQQEYAVVKKILNDYPGKFLFIFRNFPLVNERPKALDAALAAACAQEQGKFWELHDKLFTNQEEITDEVLKNLASSIDLSTVDFNTCLSSKKYLNKIEQDLRTGYAAGVRATPTFFINGYKIPGAITFPVFEKIITTQLSQ